MAIVAAESPEPPRLDEGERVRHSCDCFCCRIFAATMDAESNQASLFDTDSKPVLFRPEVVQGRSGRPAGYNLFAATLPPPGLVPSLESLGAGLRIRHHLHEKCLQGKNLHVTLHAVASFHDDAIPMQVIDAARAAAAGVACPAFPIAFDRARSFRNMRDPDSNAFVLRCDARSGAALARLRHALGKALRRCGLHPKASRTPHMTLLYDRQVITEHPIEPIGWQAAGFSLILSHVGFAHHERLGDWPFG